MHNSGPEYAEGQPLKGEEAVNVEVAMSYWAIPFDNSLPYEYGERLNHELYLVHTIMMDIPCLCLQGKIHYHNVYEEDPLFVFFIQAAMQEVHLLMQPCSSQNTLYHIVS